MSEELEILRHHELAPATRGLPREACVKGTLARFLPASLVVLGPFLLQPFSNPAAWPPLLWMAVTAGSLAVGFGAGLEGLRRWLWTDAEVDGRRSAVAGLLAPLVSGIVTSGIDDPFAMAALTAGVGVAVAVLMYFAWLTETPRADGSPTTPDSI